jgi:hypothetical protein
MLWSLVVVAIVASAATATAAQAQTSQVIRQTAQSAPILTTDRTFLASLERIGKGSALWREAIQEVRKTGRRVLVVTPADVRITARPAGRDREGFDSGALAEAIPVIGEDLQISVVVVVVNLRLLQETHDARLSLRRDFEADLDRILVHEIYGHAVPYLLAGDLSGRCPDPGQEESASAACSISRENAVRAELGLGRRQDRGLSSLTLAAQSH